MFMLPIQKIKNQT